MSTSFPLRPSFRPEISRSWGWWSSMPGMFGKTQQQRGHPKFETFETRREISRHEGFGFGWFWWDKNGKIIELNGGLNGKTWSNKWKGYGFRKASKRFFQQTLISRGTNFPWPGSIFQDELWTLDDSDSSGKRVTWKTTSKASIFLQGGAT